MNTNGELLSFAEDTSSSNNQSTHEEIDVWHLLVVDDEPEVHTMTKTVLSSFELEGHYLEFFSAYNGSEAIEVLKENPDGSLSNPSSDDPIMNEKFNMFDSLRSQIEFHKAHSLSTDRLENALSFLEKLKLAKETPEINTYA